jgi:hypothetical protein
MAKKKVQKGKQRSTNHTTGHNSPKLIKLCAMVPKENTIMPLKEMHVVIEFRALAKIVMFDLIHNTFFNFVPFRQQIWPPRAILVSDWLMLKKSSPLKLFGQMEPNYKKNKKDNNS